MSISGIHPTEKMSKKIIQWRNNNSGEIDVFEAAKYFSGANEEHYNINNKQSNLRGGRMSFDMPIMRNSSSQTTTYQQQQQHHHHHHVMDQKPNFMNKKIDSKKYKQPSSPGGRLASFLNSLFNQTSSKKNKKSSSSSLQSLKDQEDQSPSGRRKRRSSISHFSFRSSNIITTSNSNSTSSDSKSSSNSGFRTPPPYAPTPTKSYKDFKSYGYHEKKSNMINTSHEYSWLDDKLKLSKNNGLLLSEKNKTYNKVVDIDDDDGDSDSSSDLFDLPNIDLDYYSSSGLPVYETTNMDNIKRGAPISNGAL
ncbi:hypothetical protein HAX54_024630 [Datura stramonium]|uniref:Protein BIG GRAIN 1-like E n=1 Tax=Datura stramonium TaxID=4076 RepID=A0ABS8RK12_DATST|nr:hypothetical protein [Datura stramonium]